MAVSLRDERYRWLVLVLYALAAFVVAVLLVFGARWIYRSIHSPTPQQTVQQPATTNKKPQPAASKSSSKANQNQSNSSSASNQALPNNGPGDVVALFVGTSAIAAGLHYLFQIRRLSV
jgi:uncharacterized membrane protein YraQ (UPF0718 family)